MSTITLSRRVGTVVNRRSLPWLTVALLAVLLSAADTFLLTGLQGAVGSISRVHEPFLRWLRTSTLLLPVFAAAVVWGLARAQRRYGVELRTRKAVVLAALLVAAATSVVGVGEVAASSVYDYQLQSKELAQMQTIHPDHSAAAGHAHDSASCTSTCEALRSTIAVHVKGVTYASGVLVATNLFLVGWVVALRGAELAPRRRRTASAAAQA